MKYMKELKVKEKALFPDSERYQDGRFSPKLQSVYERVLNDVPRATNLLEGWHRSFSTIVAKHHPNIYDFISCLRAE